MRTPRAFALLAIAVGTATLVTASVGSTAQGSAPAVKVGAAEIGGVVTSAHGPEAGVWVIARTDDLPTRYAKIVVTDDQGRYLIPELPSNATYTVWSRGYGLVDGPQVRVTPGKLANLRAVIAPSKAAAAQFYPAEYWFAMLKIPDASEFPGTGPSGNGIGVTIKSQNQWIDTVKTDGCITCHQIGNKYTRTLPAAFSTLPSSAAGWSRRLQSGQAGPLMTNTIGTLGTHALANFGDWTDRIAKGELPAAQPPRPQGVERNVVITEWDWAAPTAYLHDEISTDKRNPRLNPYGKIYGSPEESTDYMPVLDPVKNATSWVHVPVLDPNTPDSSFTAAAKPLQPSNFWGDRRIWDSQDSMHNPMFDGHGRVWLTSRIRPPENPAFCQAGSSMESAQLFPLKAAGRQASVYDPKTGEFKLANVCFPTHHLYFASDADDTLWFSPGGGRVDVVGWLNAKEFLRTGDAAKSQGWTPLILDTTGTGKRTATYTEPGAPLDSTKDARITGDAYGMGINPADGTIWGSVLGYPGKLIHVIPGSDAPRTALTEVYELPAEDPAAPVHGFSPRGMDIDGNGVVWAPLASGHLASFDRRKCKGPLNGPKATGKQCPEGWTLYPLPGPQFNGLAQSGSAEASYFTFVDRFNTLGLGANVPLATGNLGESVAALVNGKFVVMRVPYPLGFFAKNVDGRIDDPRTGWKGRGMWTTFGSRTPFHMETGKGTKPIVLHFQVRPNPLAD
jgi:hypothetical protein